MGAAGLPEIIGQRQVKLVAHADDERLEEGAGLPARAGQAREHAAPYAGP